MVISFLSQTCSGMASGLCNDTIKYFLSHLKSRVGYLVHYKEKVDKLKECFEDLKHLKNDVQRRAEAADRDGEVVDDVVTAWLKKVEVLEQAVARLVTEAEENKRCFKGCCPDCMMHYKLGKEATEKTVESKELQEKGKFEAVSQLPPPPSFDSMPERDFMAFSSTRDAMEKVMDAMRDKKQQLIGIYGMGGVGKTTLMEELGRQFTTDQEFGTVVKVIVSQNPKISQIRRDIAEALGMTLRGDGEAAARALANRLKKEDNIVIMMDDIWDRLELREIGIPNMEEHKGCKILFTTRTLQACQLMESHASVLVDVLTPEDSWTLFKSKVGEVCDLHNIEPIARKVARECGGLPLAIVVLGRAMRGRNKKIVWENALLQLKRSIPDELTNVEEQLFKSLELSYNYIKSVEMKLLFLFCCLFREDYEISEDELTRYAVGEGFLRNVYTMDEARNKVHFLVDSLLASCLLLNTTKENYVKMHDVVRDVAVYIASKGEDCFFVKAGLGMREWPENENMERCKRISLMNNDICTLPDQPNCPKLLTLLLNINSSLPSITYNFFQGMISLTVLDLSDTNIGNLPSSLVLLTNLGALRLDRCKNLRDITLIGQLKNLKILGLQKSLVNVLPEELRNLANLKLLDISYSTSLKIPPNLISRFSRLEELLMIGYDMNEDLFDHIGSLKHLANLQVYVSDVNYFSKKVEAIDGWRNLSRFIIYTVSDWYSLVTEYQTNLYLKKVNQISNWTKLLLRKTEDLRLDDCNLDLDEGGDWESLKKLHLVNYQSMGSLLNTEHSGSSSNAFANLEQLFLANIQNMKNICHGSLPAQSFEKLRILNIFGCKDLVSIIPCHLLKRIHHNLEVLAVNLCSEATEVFNSEGFDEEIVMLPKLRSLRLTSLANLTRVCTGVIPPGSFQNLSSLQVFGSTRLEHLFSQQLVDTQLNLFPPGTFANLKEIIVCGCPRLTHLFLPSLAHELQRLERLEVKKNQEMKAIIAIEDGVVLDKGTFPRLKELLLVELPMLESFYCEAICFSWPSLEYVKLEFCQNMRRLPIGLDSAQKLKKVNVGDDDDADWFKGLEWEDPTILSRFEICKDRTG